MKKCALLLLFCLLLVPGWIHSANAQAGEAEDITAVCDISPRSPTNGLASISDRKYTTPWETATRKNPYVQVMLPEGRTCASLYICFGKMPASWEVQTLQGETWVQVVQGDTSYLHTYLELPNLTSLRIVVTSEKKTSLILNELFVFGPGEAPSFVQKWQPTQENADLMVISAHPDDELIFMGGTIPYYAVVQEKRVVACYLTPSNTTRSSELLNGLWEMGVRTYPIIGPFGDGYSTTVKNGYRRWGGKEKVLSYLTELIRRFKPKVIVTHDINGEYGHGAHQTCADAAIWCVAHAGDASVYPDSAAQYGVWKVQKLYLHLYPENELTMDWHTPYDALGGRTPLQAAQDAYALHVTQQKMGFVVTDEGEYSNARFGLYYSSVGTDTEKNDFLENIQ